MRSLWPLTKPPLSPSDTKVFSTKQILAKYVPLEEVKKAVTDIVILSASKKEDVPPGYTRLPYVMAWFPWLSAVYILYLILDILTEDF